ncbi:hypothetical protein [Desulfovibrio litoralis]|uniref:hypothetical protein n=1 Tax=Desulfovibrio litoralis TaxID=466107 RepID=UPI0015BDB9CF|nr:hypothetical protein [Desulfovibrio litoralis]
MNKATSLALPASGFGGFGGIPRNDMTLGGLCLRVALGEQGKINFPVKLVGFAMVLS